MVPARAERVIRIADQKGFDKIQQSIETAVYAGEKEISVILAPGTYYFSEKHLKLYGKDWEGIHLTLSGSGSVITSDGTDCRDGDPWPEAWDLSWQFLRPEEGSYATFGVTVQSPGLVRIVDEDRKLCRIRLPERISRLETHCKDTYIQLSRWYESRFYKVTKIQDGWIYFIADDLEGFPR